MQEQVFLLKRWRQDKEEVWKWSLKDIRDGKAEFFVSEERLLLYLQKLESMTDAEESKY